jgi:hypothetical protein
VPSEPFGAWKRGVKVALGDTNMTNDCDTILSYKCALRVPTSQAGQPYDRIYTDGITLAKAGRVLIPTRKGLGERTARPVPASAHSDPERDQRSG